MPQLPAAGQAVRGEGVIAAMEACKKRAYIFGTRWGEAGARRAAEAARVAHQPSRHRPRRQQLRRSQAAARGG